MAFTLATPFEIIARVFIATTVLHELCQISELLFQLGRWILLLWLFLPFIEAWLQTTQNIRRGNNENHRKA